MKQGFRKEHPDLEVRLNLGSSSTLVTQLANGAPGDVFASADEHTMQKAVDGKLTEDKPEVFARNTLALLVQKGNPEKIKGLEDLDRPGLTVSMCGPQVPVGRYARQALQRSGVSVPKGGEELDVKQVVSRVTMGEADVGVVYATEVLGARGKADGIAVPPARNVEARYPVGLLNTGRNTAGGRLFVDYLLSAEAQKVLRRHGFLAPA
ncbi:molybdate ABC transporter substrate-binding protein [Streptomyces sp. NPDC005931]|uniref:molybdate ABC transporter substrate-binding protein n=1 Tax=Streptomyces sp. NPDC005931 TaxID=3364737 RepID=UPI0036AF1AAD